MTNNSTTYSASTADNIFCTVYPTRSTCNTFTTYDEFLDSIDKVKEKTVLMCHLPSDIEIASKYYRGYLTDEELQEKQYKGRFWDVRGSNLYILVDDETLVVVDTKRNTKIFSGRDCLPYSLQGRHYYD